MKNKIPPKQAIAPDQDMRPEYDFTGGVRGKHYKSRLNGYTIQIHKKNGTTLVKHVRREGIVALEPDVQEYFPTAEAVNRALRTLITLFPEKKKTAGPTSHEARSGRNLPAKRGTKKFG